MLETTDYLRSILVSQDTILAMLNTIPQDQVAQLDDYMFMVASQRDPELLYTVEMRYSVVWSILVYSRTKK